MRHSLLTFGFVLLFAIGLQAEPPEVSTVFGPLKVGSAQSVVTKALGKPESKGKVELWEATGMHVGEWRYPKQGLTLNMGSEEKQGPKTVESITAVAPCSYATDRGIKIGSSEEEVKKAYGKVQDKEMSRAGDTFVAGSVYGGIIFTFEKGKVTQIFLGAAAE